MWLTELSRPRDLPFLEFLDFIEFSLDEKEEAKPKGLITLPFREQSTNQKDLSRERKHIVGYKNHPWLPNSRKPTHN